MQLDDYSDDFPPQLNEREASDKGLQGVKMVGGFCDRGLVGGQVGATGSKEGEESSQFRVVIGGGRREAGVELAMEGRQRWDRVQIGWRVQLERLGLKKGKKLKKGFRFASWRIPTDIVWVFHVVLDQLDHLVC